MKTKLTMMALTLLAVCACNRSIERPSFAGVKLGAKAYEVRAMIMHDFQVTETGIRYKKVELNGRTYYFRPINLHVNKDSILLASVFAVFPSIDDLNESEIQGNHIDLDTRGIAMSPLKGAEKCTQTYYDIWSVLSQKYGLTQGDTASNSSSYSGHFIRKWQKDEVEIYLFNTWDNGPIEDVAVQYRRPMIPSNFSCSIQILYRYSNKFRADNNLNIFVKQTDAF